MKVIKIKNISGGSLSIHIHSFSVSEIYTISTEDEQKSWADNDDTLVAVINEDIEIHNGDGAIGGISNQIDYLKNLTTIENIPLEPKNLHTMSGRKQLLSFTPTWNVDHYDVEDIYFALTSTTHVYLRLWGAKLQMKMTSAVHEDDEVKIKIVDKDNVLGYGAGLVLSEYADWYLSAEGGKIYCPKAPDSASGGVPNGCYIKIEYTHAATTQGSGLIKGWANWIVTTKDGEEIPA